VRGAIHVIGTPVGGIPDIVEDGETGCVVPEDHEAFASKIDHLADHPETHEQRSEAARASVEGRTWDHVAGQVEAVYEQVCDETGDT
jgi:glycosyltransferase involved in cell wall biosynthesis